MDVNKKKITRGRQKVVMKRVEHEAKREVTFSKRKKGLFSKAAELCELCGAEVALFLFSPHLKPFTFGHPDANHILHRFLTGEDPSGLPEASNAVPHPDLLHAVREQYKESLKRLEEEEEKEKEKKRKNEKSTCTSGGFWWDQEIENISELDELEQYVESMQKLKKIVEARVHASFANEFINHSLFDQNNFNLIPYNYSFDGI